MKTILAFAGLAVFLGVAAMVHLGLKESKREQAIIGLSNGLVWSALQAQVAPRMVNSKLKAVEGDRRWQVTGDLVFRDPGGVRARQPYRAVVAQTCALSDRRECWSLESLVVGDEVVDVAVLNQTPADPAERRRNAALEQLAELMGGLTYVASGMEGDGIAQD